MARTAHRLSMQVDGPMRDSVADEQLRMVWSHARAGIVMATAFAILLALLLRGSAAAAAVVDAWLAVKIVVAACASGRGGSIDAPGSPAAASGGSPPRAAGDRRHGVGHRRPGADAGADSAGVAGRGLAGVRRLRRDLRPAGQRRCHRCLRRADPCANGGRRCCCARDEVGSFGGTGLLMLLGLQLVTARARSSAWPRVCCCACRPQALAAEKDAALKLALRQSAVKTQFLAKMSHELRTPLHGILGIARLLHLEANDSAVVRRVELIEQSGTHLLGLINDLLDISRHRCRPVGPARRALRPGRSNCASVAGIYAVRAEEKGLELRRCRSRSGRSTSSSAIRRGCDRCCTTCSATPSSSPTAARSGSTPAPGDTPDVVRIAGSRYRRWHRRRRTAAHLRGRSASRAWPRHDRPTEPVLG